MSDAARREAADPATRAAASEVIRGVLATLNALTLSEVSRVRGELDRAREALGRLGHPEFEAMIDDAQGHLRSGQLKEFRRTIATVTARLGHLR